jgi:tellurite resistance protein
MSNSATLIRSENGKLLLYTPEYDTVKERLESKWFQNDKFIHFFSVLDYSKDFIDDLARICSASIMSDDEHKEEETFVTQEICKEMSIDWDDFNILLESELEKVKSNEYDSVKEYLLDSQFGKQTKNSMLLFEVALHIILADGIMTDKEAQLLADFAEILEIPIVKVISRIAQFLRFEKEILIDVEL